MPDLLVCGSLGSPRCSWPSLVSDGRAVVTTENAVTVLQAPAHPESTDRSVIPLLDQGLEFL